MGESEVDWCCFACDCSYLEFFCVEIDVGCVDVVREREQLKPAGAKSIVNECMKVVLKEKALKCREAELEQLEKVYAVFAAKRAWCFMPAYPCGASEFRHDLAGN